MIRQMRDDLDLMPLQVLATQMHEFFVVLMERGFSEEQALKLIAMRLEQGG